MKKDNKIIRFKITDITKDGSKVKGHISHEWIFEDDIFCSNCGKKGVYIDKLLIEKNGWRLFCPGCDRIYDLEEISYDSEFTQIKDHIKAFIINNK